MVGVADTPFCFLGLHRPWRVSGFRSAWNSTRACSRDAMHSCAAGRGGRRSGPLITLDVLSHGAHAKTSRGTADFCGCAWWMPESHPTMVHGAGTRCGAVWVDAGSLVAAPSSLPSNLQLASAPAAAGVMKQAAESPRSVFSQNHGHGHLRGTQAEGAAPLEDPSEQLCF